MGRITARTSTQRVTLDAGVQVVRRADTLAVEEPLQIRVDGAPLTVTMRTPGDDFDLTLGFLVAEGLVTGADDVRTLMHCLDEDESGRPTFNVVDVTPRPGLTFPDVSQRRSFASTSACGVCGTTSVDEVRQRSPYDVAADQTRWAPATLAALPAALESAQTGFARTGGLHAAGLFSASGELLVAREDVGRHNAVDKVVGWAARQHLLPLTGCVLAVSSRASFELTQKALMAGIPCLAAISAPSTLAVQLARDSGLTLVGFLRPPRMTVYAGDERLSLPG